MKTKIYISMAVTVLIAIATFFWFQSCRKSIGSVEPLSTKHIIKELTEANTPEKAETAITHLFEKVGIGIENKNSDFEQFKINFELLSSLAMAQSKFVNGNKSVTIGQYYSLKSKAMDRIMIVSNNKFVFESTLNKSLQDLYKASIAAKKDIETPNNALLLTISSEKGEIPDQIIQCDSATILSPIQNFCYSLWIFNRYGQYNIDKSGAAVKFWCELGCYAAYYLQTSACDGYLPLFPDEYVTCLSNASAALDQCLAGCHNQGSGD